MNNPNLSVLLSFLLLSACQTPPVETGLDRIEEYRHFFEGKRVGLVTNHTAYNSKEEHIIDVFGRFENMRVTALFGPEHGIRGHEEAGKRIQSESDPVKDIPIFSLYGRTRKPTADMLANVDILVFDIQDIGSRFYTYIYTMALAMEAAAEQNKPFVVLDRPNPITGAYVEGNLLEPEFASFIGLYPIPVRHGMTVGELATMFNKEGWLKNGVTANLTVVPMNHWQRSFWYDETGLRFIKPSPNIPDMASAILYPGMCLLEGTHVSEGRGTSTPFQILGAPWINGTELSEELNTLKLPGIVFRDTTFTPVSIPGAAQNPKYKGQECEGVFVKTTNRQKLQPYFIGISVVNTIHELYPDSLQWHTGHFDRLCGSAIVRETILQGGHIAVLQRRWRVRLQDFMKIRQKYLMYD